MVRTQYGSPDVRQFTEAEKPIPKDDEILLSPLNIREGKINAGAVKRRKHHYRKSREESCSTLEAIS